MFPVRFSVLRIQLDPKRLWLHDLIFSEEGRQAERQPVSHYTGRGGQRMAARLTRPSAQSVFWPCTLGCTFYLAQVSVSAWWYFRNRFRGYKHKAELTENVVWLSVDFFMWDLWFFLTLSVAPGFRHIVIMKSHYLGSCQTVFWMYVVRQS